MSEQRTDLCSHELWQLFKQKATEEYFETAGQFEVSVFKVCSEGITLSETIAKTFPNYTLHNVIHIKNVLSIMLDLLGDRKHELSTNECALLLMSACCHDIGMSLSDEEKQYLQGCPVCMQEYLETHPTDYNIAYSEDNESFPNITDEVLQHFVRNNHHKRVREKIQDMEWPYYLGKHISAEDLIAVCQSHGENAANIMQMKIFSPDPDLFLCSVLLRLADILDFDASRAPEVLFKYINLGKLDGVENEISRKEWQKHQASYGFKFFQNSQRTLLYRAECTNIQIEQAIVSYLNWVDAELSACDKLVRHMEERWRSFLLPNKISRQISAKGYVSGEYKITLDKSQILKLLVGEKIYSDGFVYVRELIQNAIDAVRTRKQFDHNLPTDWTPQINIRTWMDSDGFYWFQVEDNGIGMTEEIIRNYFLSVGKSYYSSDEFKADRIRFHADDHYKPISQFGIGLLSCFMGDLENTYIELTTRHFKEGKDHYPAYRLSIRGVHGYYYLANEIEHRTVAPNMPSANSSQIKYIDHAGTIIAVRTNPFQKGNFKGFKNVVLSFLAYPEIPIHYQGPDGSCDFPTENDFMDACHSVSPRTQNNVYTPIEKIVIKEEQMEEIKEKFPFISWQESPGVGLYCIPLDYWNNSLISGAIFYVRAEGKPKWNEKSLFEKYNPKVKVEIDAYSSDGRTILRNEIIILKIYIEIPPSRRKVLEGKIFSELRQKSLLSTNDDKQITNYMHSSELREKLIKIIAGLSVEDLECISASELCLFSACLCKVSCFSIVSEFKHIQWVNLWFDPDYDLPIVCNTSLIVHNGIQIDKGRKLLFPKSSFQKAIILLKDKYCPLIDISRDTAKEYPLELLCFMEILHEELSNNQEFDFRLDLSENKYDCITPVKDYQKIANQFRPFFSSLRFPTKCGKLTLNEIDVILKDKGYILVDFERLSPFFKSVLLSMFFLQITDFSCNEGVPTISISSPKENNAQQKEFDFPPGLFLSTSDEISAFGAMRNGDAVNGASYNINHRFSQWLIKNRRLLVEKVPALYNNLICELCGKAESNAGLLMFYSSIIPPEFLSGKGDLVARINNILSRIRNIPCLDIAAPPLLSHDDFIVITDGYFAEVLERNDSKE